jgi:hypothetical protein
MIAHAPRNEPKDFNIAPFPRGETPIPEVWFVPNQTHPVVAPADLTK